MGVATTTGGNGDDDWGHEITNGRSSVRNNVRERSFAYSKIAVEISCTSTESEIGDGSGPHRAFNAETDWASAAHRI